MVSESETHPGLFHGFGFNGHGFLLGPAVGAVLTELIVDGKTKTEIGGLGIGRFRPPRKTLSAPAHDQHPDEDTEADSEEDDAQQADQGRVGGEQQEEAPGNENGAERSQEP